MATQTKEVATQEKAVVQWKGEAITISFRDVKSLICHLATDQETAVFLKTCQSLNLNPFAGEIYLIKYSEKDKAAMVIAIDSYLKAAETNDNYNGHEAGIILKDSAGKLEFREGSFHLGEEADKLVGGWAKVYRKDREKPFYMAVNKAECLRYTKDGHLTQFWTVEKQPSMLRKTALKRALVEAFPQLFAGAYSTAEFEEIPEGELPPAYEKAGETNWKKWWARQKEKGLSPDEVHNILGIGSLKEDWLEKGRTLEEAEDIINDALEQAKSKVTQEKTEVEGEGFHIDLAFLKESLKALNWTEETAKSWLVSRFKLKDTKGTLAEVISRLSRKQAEEFTREIAERVTQKAQSPKMI